MRSDPRFDGRIRRLAATSVVALGLIWLLAELTLDAHPAIGATLAGGWVLMPAVLWLSLGRPALRYGLAVPSTLVTVGLAAICVTALPADAAVRAGWQLVTAGILCGGLLGIWFWFRWLPVPAALHEPFALGRSLLIGIHVALIVVGLLLVGIGGL
ncbi:MAG: hypothetical protein M3354_06035 [Chloroflexota bacterium]|nr:hypothetical protein [Chloroflexota bacterium]